MSEVETQTDLEFTDEAGTDEPERTPGGSSSSGAEPINLFHELENKDSDGASALDGAAEAITKLAEPNENENGQQDEEQGGTAVSENIGGSSASSVISNYESNGWVGVAIENSDQYTIENGEMVTYSASGERSVGDQSGLGPMIGELLSNGHTIFEYTHEGKNRVIITELNGTDIVYHTFEEPPAESLAVEPPAEIKPATTQPPASSGEAARTSEGVSTTEVTGTEKQVGPLQTTSSAATKQQSSEKVSSQVIAGKESQHSTTETKGTASSTEASRVLKTEAAPRVENVAQAEPSLGRLANSEQATDRSVSAPAEEAGKSAQRSGTETNSTAAAPQSELPPAAKIAEGSGIRLVHLSGEAFYASQAESTAPEKSEPAEQGSAELHGNQLATSLQTFARLINQGPSRKETSDQSPVTQASSAAPIKIKAIQPIGRPSTSEAASIRQVDTEPEGGGPQGPELGLSRLENGDGFIVTQTTASTPTRVQATFTSPRTSQNEQSITTPIVTPEPNGGGPSNEILFSPTEQVAETSDAQNQAQHITATPAVAQSLTVSERSTVAPETPEPNQPTSGPDAPLAAPLAYEYSTTSKQENSSVVSTAAQTQSTKNVTRVIEQPSDTIKITQQDTAPRSPVTPTSPIPTSEMGNTASSRSSEQSPTVTDQASVTAPVKVASTQAVPVRPTTTEQRIQTEPNPVIPSGPQQPITSSRLQVEPRVAQEAQAGAPVFTESAQTREVTRVTEREQAEPAAQQTRLTEVPAAAAQSTSRVTVLPGQRIRFEQPATAVANQQAAQRNQVLQFSRPGLASVADDTAAQATTQVTTQQLAA